MKVKKSTHLNPFGGINFVFNRLDHLKIDKLLSQNLPQLANQSIYSWKDILYSFWSIFLCGGSCIEDVDENLKYHLGSNPFINVPSPDRILSRFKELANSTELFRTPRGTTDHIFSMNAGLNELMIKISKSLGMFSMDDIVLDYDNTIIYTNKADSKKTYKKAYGYQPGVGIIGNQIVYVENRNGNSNAAALQEETLKRTFELLESNEIKVNKFRADGASYSLKVFELLDQKVENYFIRVQVSQAIGKQIMLIDNWQEVNLGSEIGYRAEVRYIPFNAVKKANYKKECRLVITKVARKDRQINLFTKEQFIYRVIITNDFEMSMDEVVCFYNQRGAIEKEFDVLKNDFGWNNMAFSKLEHNCVFLIFTAICRNLYDYLIKFYSKKIKRLKPTDRVKKFIFRFICIPAKWIKQSRQIKLILYGNINFCP